MATATAITTRTGGPNGLQLKSLDELHEVLNKAYRECGLWFTNQVVRFETEKFVHGLLVSNDAVEYMERRGTLGKSFSKAYWTCVRESPCFKARRACIVKSSAALDLISRLGMSPKADVEYHPWDCNGGCEYEEGKEYLSDRPKDEPLSEGVFNELVKSLDMCGEEEEKDSDEKVMKFLNGTFRGDAACDHCGTFCDCITEGGDPCVCGGGLCWEDTRETKES